ncbi:double-strand break repair protein AddB [Pacificimonas sp. WHA3]|uniref:Double-strand break repair protein AddB n=1 Tax=Pacificimonas pallii TaxID=2827236 RepID=A0ABS6SAR3_9SPHN|nr:double-strand break repair protein AddB [Pacificimonas pallii]MBV7255487.1 double-strand break repair protein AddB [Pacificimonas pallii]
MATRRLYTIAPHQAFADRLAATLLSGYPFARGDELSLARTLVLLPNRRSARAVQDAFVRASEGALLLPRLAVLGDLDDELMPGLPAGADALAGPPQIGELERTLRLMPLVEAWQRKTGQTRAKVETLRYAEALGRTLDLMQLYEVGTDRLTEAVEADMAVHWRSTATFLNIVREAWPEVLKTLGKSDRVAERQALLMRLAVRWRDAPPPHPVIAAGIANADPVAAALLGTIAQMPRGAVVLPGLDQDMDEAAWDALSAASTHPQAPLAALLRDMSASRADVRPWPGDAAAAGGQARTDMLAHALAAPRETAHWRDTPPPAQGAQGMRAVAVRSPAEEARAIALAMREALEVPGRTAALVTPDRDLARRVAAQMRRWGVEVDDSAGTPLSLTPPGALLGLLLEAAKSGFAPVPLLAVLKHPLVGPGEDRARWLRNVRHLDLALRGVRPARGLQAVGNRLRRELPGTADVDGVTGWWKAAAAALRPLAEIFRQRVTGDLAAVAGKLREVIAALSDERFWDGPSGRAASELLSELERYGGVTDRMPTADLPALMSALAGSVPVRPLYGRHPRLAIYGLLEARLQRADLMILGGLNEGVWPPADHFDPWLPPGVRRALGLPPTDRTLALSAHDFVAASGAPEVLLTRAARDASAPTVASRYWLRLQAFLGADLPHDDVLAALAADMDGEEPRAEIRRPAPAPPHADRRRAISVTQVETLRADPYQFYARYMLRLSRLDPLGASPEASERGVIVHDLMEKLHREGTLQDVAAREAAIDAALSGYSDHILLRVLWKPRVMRMLDWAAAQVAEYELGGWHVASVERKGHLDVDGVKLTGKADVIFQKGATLAVVDYKTGAPPQQNRIAEGYADQLALLSWLARSGRLGTESLPVAMVAYWRLSGGRTEGTITSSETSYRKVWKELEMWFDDAEARFRETAAMYLTGDAPFTARLKPEFAPFNDYAQLARVQEWEGR